MELENQLALGNGIYTISEIAQILRIPYDKASRWINQFWDGELGKIYESSYSWTVQDTRAVSFHTLVELNVLIQLGEAGVKTRAVLNAHKELSDLFNTPFPFAVREVIENLRTDGKKVYFQLKNDTISLDGTRQFNLDFIKLFIRNLDFDKDEIASKYWPMGREKQIVIDPKRQFGHPVLADSNIFPETIFSLFRAGEPIKFIAFTYNLSEKSIKDAITFCEAA